jgi:hypothetical protein
MTPSSPVNIPIARNKSSRGVPKNEDSFEANIANDSNKPTIKNA